MRNDTFIQHDYPDKKHIRRHQQKIAEKYWKEKQIGENGTSKSTVIYFSKRSVRVCFLL